MKKTKALKPGRYQYQIFNAGYMDGIRSGDVPA